MEPLENGSSSKQRSLCVISTSNMCDRMKKKIVRDGKLALECYVTGDRPQARRAVRNNKKRYFYEMCSYYKLFKAPSHDNVAIYSQY